MNGLVHELEALVLARGHRHLPRERGAGAGERPRLLAVAIEAEREHAGGLELLTALLDT
jgi:hypothetical protein